LITLINKWQVDYHGLQINNNQGRQYLNNLPLALRLSIRTQKFSFLVHAKRLRW